MFRGRIAPLALGFCLAGCVNNVAKFDHPNPHFAEQVARGDFDIPAKPATIYTYSADHDHDNRALLENGFEMVGYTSFNAAGSGAMSNRQLLEQAKSVEAAMVLVSSKYTGTVSGVIPFTTQNPNQLITANTTGAVNSYGSAGYATSTYNATTTAIVPGGSTTTYLPYNVNRFDYGATFWAKRKKYVLGAYFSDLSSAQRAKYERNQGVEIKAVVKGTPAFTVSGGRGRRR